ncbi:lipoate--protein ligase [Desulfoplanes sp.]
MYLIPNNGITDPRVNLALEEYCLKNLDPENDYLLLYVNEPSIIVGRFQNTLEEINLDYVEDNGIHVVRRISGGGAVYHDHGNLNFSFMTRYAKDNLLNFRKFTGPVIQALKNMGIPAELSGRNDILAQGKKISGNAQYATRTSMLSHGTLLFDSDMETLVRALNVSDDKITSKALKSVRSRVVNIVDCLSHGMDMAGFKTRLIESVFAPFGGGRAVELTPDQWADVHGLAGTKYGSWDWNFGKSPGFNVQKKERFSIGQVDTRIQVEGGRTTSVKIFGDFLGHGDIARIEELLTGIPYKRQAVRAGLQHVDLSEFFGPMETERFVDYLCG